MPAAPSRLRHRRGLRRRRWPVRWRIAVVSAGLTFAILVVFALVVGQLVADRLRDDFRTNLALAAGRLAAEIDPMRVTEQDLSRITLTGGAVVRVAYEDGTPFSQPRGTPPLGPPRPSGVRRVGAYEVAAFQIFGAGTLSDNVSPMIPPLYVQVARPRSELDETVGRLWLFLTLGVLGGTALAALAGLAVANRAMRPIADLTATADRVARTRDPSLGIEDPGTDDEVAELARMLDTMLSELDSARRESQHMVQAQREFVADASHELRTPLTSVQANLELLQASLRSDAEGDAAVGSALRSAKRMARLVADLLMLARADAGRRGPRSAVDLAEIARAAVGEASAVADGRELVVDAEPGALVEGNPDELHRLVLNLVENGIAHSPGGSRVRVEVSSDAGRVELVVEDDGPGIPEGMEEEIFGRFVRASGPADRSSRRGTGLGLAIVRAVAEGHGGEVRAANATEGGARFTVELPHPAQEPTDV